MSRLNEELVETSRRAGMAEVTTGVLHNIGNVLNSANVSAAVVKQRIETSCSGNLLKVVALLQEHSGIWAPSSHPTPRANWCPTTWTTSPRRWSKRKSHLLEETNSLIINVDHIKDIITSNRTMPGLERGGRVRITELIEDALRMSSGGFARRGISIQRDLQDTPPVRR